MREHILVVPETYCLSCADFWVSPILGMSACRHYVIDPLLAASAPALTESEKLTPPIRAPQLIKTNPCTETGACGELRCTLEDTVAYRKHVTMELVSVTTRMPNAFNIMISCLRRLSARHCGNGYPEHSGFYPWSVRSHFFFTS